MKRRITQMDVARAANVHNTTVSLALRNCPSIPETTRKRIQALAAQLGYCPDPTLRALVAYRQGLSARRRTEALAYVTNGATKWGWRDAPIAEQYFLGAQRKAAECGYQLEHFWLGEPGMSPRRLGQMLFHRGVSGVLLASHESDAAEPPDFDWQHLTTIQLGCLMEGPALHRVTAHFEGAVRLAMRRAAAAGYRRVGMVLPDAWDRSIDRAWSATFVGEQNRLRAMTPIPVFFQEQPSPKSGLEDGVSEDTVRFANWFAEFQPDAVLGSFAMTHAICESLGIRIPQDVAFVDLLHDGANSSLAGIRQNCARAGEVAVEILIQQLQQNLRGLPAAPTTTLVESIWCQGASMPLTEATPWTTHPAREKEPAGPREQTAA